MFGQRTLEGLGLSEANAYAICEDVRQRDEDRLHVQASEGIMAGRHLLFNKPVTPEPLVKPQREGQRIDKAGDGIDAVANLDEGTASAAVAAE
ncbi:hypothetical protein D3C80_1194890 [compost metagenome]